MNHRIAIACFLVAPVSVAGCFQELDTGVARGGGPSTFAPDASAGGAGPTSCAPDSTECFELCSAPHCYLPEPDGSIPVVQQTPPIYNDLGEGGSTMDPCVQVEQQSMVLRERSCTPCHTPSLNAGSFNSVLVDTKLATESATATNPATGKAWRMLVPGAPASSYIYQRMLDGIRSGGKIGMPPADNVIRIYTTQSVARPNVSDLSILDAWITNCVAGADGGAFSSFNYGAGGGYGPPPGGNGPGMGGPGAPDGE